MDYRNADGSVAEMCGNGIRVFARYLVRHGLAAGPEFTVGTRSGPRRIRMGAGGGITVDMGAVAVLGPGNAVLAGRAYPGLRVSVGNPHLACLVDVPLVSFDLSRAPELDPGQFPGGGNVELVRVTGPRSVAMRVHERGSGETRSCGTGAIAAAAAAAAASGSGDGAWEVSVPGGGLTVTLAAGRAWLTGPAVIVAEGELDPSWLAGPAASLRDHGDLAAPPAALP
jgi:diaminopimelate epimerase